MRHEDCLGLLSPYVDGEVTPAETHEVESHIVDCRSCLLRLNSLRRSRSMLRSIPSPSIPQDLKKALLKAAAEADAPRRRQVLSWMHALFPPGTAWAYAVGGLLFAVISLTACDSWDLTRGRRYEESGRFPLAVKSYESFADKRPDDPRSAEALVRAGTIYAKAFNRCLESKRLYETALRRFPKEEPWAARAKAGLMACPEYFPIEMGRSWVFGDTASKGKNMRLERQVTVSSAPVSAEVRGVLYAGDKVIKEEHLVYTKKEWAVWEAGEERDVPILRYPFQAGNEWKTQVGEDVLEYSVVSVDAEVDTVAGVFARCLKIKEFNPRFAESWKYDYYAPGVGRVKTTIGGPGFENPNTELVEFVVP